MLIDLETKQKKKIPENEGNGSLNGFVDVDTYRKHAWKLLQLQVCDGMQ